MPLTLWRKRFEIVWVGNPTTEGIRATPLLGRSCTSLEGKDSCEVVAGTQEHKGQIESMRSGSPQETTLELIIYLLGDKVSKYLGINKCTLRHTLSTVQINCKEW